MSADAIWREARVNDRETAIDGTERDWRTPFQHDRDRILYSHYFRRLAETTQVVSAADGHVFHNRLTHRIEVAQIGRRLAERLVGTADPGILEAVGGLDPDVVEAACLAHDLGHPPFGHIGEQELDALVVRYGDSNGYEGNAQSFRIVTRLAVHPRGGPGLNLTRATLRAIVKYPWYRETSGYHKAKFGAYNSDDAAFRWSGFGRNGEAPDKSVEAEVMDWADDIAYSIYDVDDFFRADIIPLELLARSGGSPERDRFLDATYAQWERDFADDLARQPPSDEEFQDAADYVFTLFPIEGERFRGTMSQRAAIGGYISELVTRYSRSLRLTAPQGPGSRRVAINQSHENEVRILKHLTRYYVIADQNLAGIQQGQRAILRSVFEIYMDASAKSPAILPISAQEQLEAYGNTSVSEAMRARVVADVIAGMTERQLLDLHRRLTGVDQGSFLDPIVM